MATFNLPNAINSCLMEGRLLFSRLVFSFMMEPSISMEIIAFWLLLEGNGLVDLLQRINSFEDNQVLAIASAGKKFIETLHGNPDDLTFRSKTASEFREYMVVGIASYLKNVCYKALNDLRRKANQGMTIHEMEESVYSISQACQDCKDQHHRSTIRSSDHQGEFTNFRSIVGASRHLQDMVKLEGGAHSINPFETCLDIRSPWHQQNIGVSMISGSNIRALESSLSRCMLSSYYPSETSNSFPQSDLVSSMMNVDPYFYSNMQHHHPLVPQDERILFVTFSNGYPLTKREVYDFFMRHFGDVERVIIEEPNEPRAPQYAAVVFGSSETLLHVLDGKEKVKFMAGGKHLWARKFEPKENKFGLLLAHQLTG